MRNFINTRERETHKAYKVWWLDKYLYCYAESNQEAFELAVKYFGIKSQYDKNRLLVVPLAQQTRSYGDYTYGQGSIPKHEQERKERDRLQKTSVKQNASVFRQTVRQNKIRDIFG